MRNKAQAIDSKNIFELEDKINEFGKTHDIFSSQIFLKSDNSYDCLIWFKENSAEPIFDKGPKGEPATDKQLYTIRKAGLEVPEDLTKSEAFLMIKKIKGEK